MAVYSRRRCSRPRAAGARRWPREAAAMWICRRRRRPGVAPAGGGRTAGAVTAARAREWPTPGAGHARRQRCGSAGDGVDLVLLLQAAAARPVPLQLLAPESGQRLARPREAAAMWIYRRCRRPDVAPGGGRTAGAIAAAGAREWQCLARLRGAAATWICRRRRRPGASVYRSRGLGGNTRRGPITS
ncbi:hypothetical protein LMG31884_46870 (plasmid) [Xanthomonas hydrangeae]|nr:hypothetical protein LMG31884_46870 [Xanthomonas hydrangeae]CAD7740605.1 hypothetical protein LMG31884_46870 [Xanthomonas hydrangeae]